MFSQAQRLPRYGVAIAAVATALLIMLVLDPVLQLNQTSFLFFYGAVTVSAWHGGRNPGILAALLSAAIVDYLYLDPLYSFSLSVVSGSKLVIFFLEGLLVSLLVGSLHTAQRQARQHLNQLRETDAEINALNQVLRQRVDELQTLFNAIPINIAIAEDRNCNVIRINPAFAELLQISPDANASVTPPATQPPPAYKFYQHGRELMGDELPQQYAAKHGVEIANVEIDLVRPDHSVFNLYGHAIPLFDEFGEPRGSIAVYVDITERKQAEVALQEKEQQLQQLSDSMPQFVWINNAQGELQYINRKWIDYAGLTLEQSQDFEHIIQVFHPDDQTRVLEEWSRSLQCQQPYELEMRLRQAATQTYRWFLSRCIPVFDEEGTLFRWYGTSTDIHEHKLAQLNDRFLKDLDHCLRQLSDAAVMEWEVVSRLGEYLAVDRCLWNSIDTDRGLVTVQQDWRQQDFLSVTGQYYIAEYILPNLIDQFHDGQTAVVSDVSCHPDTAPFTENLLALDIRAFISVPCLFEGRWVASLLVTSQTVRQWRSDEVTLLQESVARLWPLLEQTRAIATLSQSEERLRLAMEASELGTWDVDLITGQAIWSERHFTLLGFEPLPSEQASEKIWIDRIHPDDRDRVLHQWVQARVDRRLYRCEYRVIRADNHQVSWLAAVGSFTYDKHGEAIRSLGVIFDISERKRAEQSILTLNQQLQAKVTELQTLLDVIPIGIGIAEDRDCRSIRVNPAFAQLLNVPAYANASMSAPESERITPFKLYQNGRELLPDELPLQYAAKHGVEIHDLELDVVWQDGTVVTLLEYAAPLLDESGHPRGSIGVFLDITARKEIELALQQSEERYRYLAELIPQLVWTADATGMLLDVTQRWTEFTGLSLEQAQLQGWEAVVHPDDLPSLLEQWHTCQQQRSFYRAEGRMRQADGSYRWHLHQAVPQKNLQGQIVKWFGTATDIEEHKRLEQQRDDMLQRELAARQQAERANRIKDEFLSILSHELRSPLNPILGWSRLLQAKTFDETKTKQALATIERNARLQTQLIDDLLDVAKILRGKLSLNKTRTDLISVIEAALEVTAAVAAAKSIAVTTEFDPVPPVMGDSTRLQQIVWNLLSNAIKFTPEGGQIVVRLEAVRVAAPDRTRLSLSTHAQITVTDSGKGISPEFLPYIFESFRQEDVSTTRQYGGLGLGLSIVKYLVDAHDGMIIVDSPGEGLGATFTLRLPLLKDESMSSMATSAAETEINLSGIRVLAVDDSEDTRELLAITLAQYGAEAQIVASGAELLECLASFQPHILLCDIGMPDMDGFEVLQSVRALPTDQGGAVPAIAVTAFTREEDYQKTLEVGFQRHLPKPILPEKLATEIATLVKSN